MKSILPVAAVLSVLALGACSTTAEASSRRPVTAITGSAPFVNHSPMSSGFQCLREDLSNTGLHARIGVSDIRDFTGKFSYEATQGGSTVTQGATLMVMSALNELAPSIRQIERYDMKIAEVEQGLTERRLLGDPPPANSDVQVVERPHISAVYQGTDYYIAGGITEINYNIRSGGAQLEIAQIGGGRRSFVMDVTVDLRLVRTSDLSIVDTVTVRKQIIGYETKAGIFKFFGDYLIDLNAGSKNQEPIQLGVRSTLEMAVMELVPQVLGTSFDRCRDFTNASFR